MIALHQLCLKVLFYEFATFHVLISRVWLQSNASHTITPIIISFMVKPNALWPNPSFWIKSEIKYIVVTLVLFGVE